MTMSTIDAFLVFYFLMIIIAFKTSELYWVQRECFSAESHTSRTQFPWCELMIETVCLFKCELEGFVKINSTLIISTSGWTLISLFSVLGNCCFIWSVKITPVAGPEMEICAREWDTSWGRGGGEMRRVLRQLSSPAGTVYTKDIKKTISSITRTQMLVFRRKEANLCQS